MNDALQHRLRNALRRHIERVGMREVAKRAGMHHPTISAWLAGRRTMPLHRIHAVAAACGMDLGLDVWLRPRADRPHRAQADAVEPLSRNTRDD